MTTRRMTILGVAIGLVLGVAVVLIALVGEPQRRTDGGGAADRSAPALRHVEQPPGPAAAAPPTTPAPPSVIRGREAMALRLFAAWSRRRSAAWASDEITELRALYASAVAARADVRLWSDYRQRGLSVVGMTSQVVAIRVHARADRRLVIVVDERSAGGVVVGPDNREVALPRDQVDRRRVVLVRRDGQLWRVARVDAVGARVRSR
ncbi:hypothetical protein ACLM5J_19110 [Nocardioides sp. Bht2]|uniref:hypothetical protein n=1 Tax=Nocardioides sp. Bht2 TaxID=3392297 RepID=UPI0039B50D93